MDKPRAKRRECLAKIKVSWQAAGVPRTEWGKLQDKSTTGFGFRFPVPMIAGSLAAVQLGFTTHFGVVRNCAKIDGQYFIGFELCEVDESVKINQASKHLAEQQPREAENEASAPLPEVRKPIASPCPAPPPSTLSRNDFEMNQPK